MWSEDHSRQCCLTVWNDWGSVELHLVVKMICLFSGVTSPGVLYYCPSLLSVLTHHIIHSNNWFSLTMRSALPSLDVDPLNRFPYKGRETNVSSQEEKYSMMNKWLRWPTNAGNRGFFPKKITPVTEGCIAFIDHWGGVTFIARTFITEKSEGEPWANSCGVFTVAVPVIAWS